MSLFQATAKTKRVRKTKEAREGKHISKETIDHDDSTDDESPPKTVNDEDKTGNAVAGKDDDRKKINKKDVSKREPKKKKNISGPLHITANNEPVAIGVIGDLDPTIFNQVSVRLFCYV